MPGLPEAVAPKQHLVIYLLLVLLVVEALILQIPGPLRVLLGGLGERPVNIFAAGDAMARTRGNIVEGFNGRRGGRLGCFKRIGIYRLSGF